MVSYIYKEIKFNFYVFLFFARLVIKLPDCIRAASGLLIIYRHFLGKTLAGKRFMRSVVSEFAAVLAAQFKNSRNTLKIDEFQRKNY